MRGWILLSPYWKAHEFNLKLSEKKLQLEKRIILFVRTIVHVTMPKLYFSWSYLHFLSWLSLEIAHSSNSVPHCPLSFLFPVADLYLPNSLPPSASANSLLTSPIRGMRSLASPTLASFFAPADSSDQTKTPPPQGSNPRFLSAHLPLLSQSILALFGLYFSCKTVTTERKMSFFFFFFDTGWPWYSLDSGENWLKFFFSLKLQNWFFLHMQLKNS